MKYGSVVTSRDSDSLISDTKATCKCLSSASTRASLIGCDSYIVIRDGHAELVFVEVLVMRDFATVDSSLWDFIIKFTVRSR